ncbi:hypothetical protein [Trichlorobacter lovleyi]|uniref:hypothetical protein n=1 Tax=Trichlorobacter lovleyi TaxID=313985 RepID=UPI003D0AC728
MKPTVTINGTAVVFKSLTIRQAYDLDAMPELTDDLRPLYMAFESDFTLVLLSADCEPDLLLEGNEAEIMEAFRKANPFVEKPLFKELRGLKNKIIEKTFSGLSAGSSSEGTLEPGTTP